MYIWHSSTSSKSKTTNWNIKTKWWPSNPIMTAIWKWIASLSKGSGGIKTQPQPLGFIMGDKVDRCKVESLSFSQQPKKKQTFSRVPHYSKCDFPPVWRGRHFSARLRSPCWHCYGGLWWPFVSRDSMLLKSAAHKVWGPSAMGIWSQIRIRSMREEGWSTGLWEERVSCFWSPSFCNMYSNQF